jgi:nitrite reductase/ring-hydroxylating ferredoxin subunit
LFAKKVNKISVIVICIGENDYHALRNSCPHQGAELVSGRLGGITVAPNVGEIVYERENEMIQCPWHRFQFDVKTGCSLYHNDTMKIKKYHVEIDNENIVIEI